MKSKISWNKLGTVTSAVRTNASEIQKPLHQNSDLSPEMRQGIIWGMGCIRQMDQPQIAHCSNKLLPEAQVAQVAFGYDVTKARLIENTSDPSKIQISNE